MKTYYTKRIKVALLAILFLSSLQLLTSQTIVGDYDFNTGNDNWTDAGTYAGRTTGAYNCGGAGAIFIQYDYDLNTTSRFTSPILDVSGYTDLTFSFCLLSLNLENNEGFDLQFFDGSAWNTVSQFRKGTDFTGDGSGTSTNLSVSISDATYNFAANSQFRFIGQMSATDEYSVFDDVLITATGCSTTVNTFPYNEGFETGLGNWIQDSNDTRDWTRTNVGTPSANTGPLAAYEGSFYLFTEGSNPNFNQTFNLIRPCIDLSGFTNADFSFYYHMYGNNMGVLDVEISTDNGATWSAPVWTQTGEAQANQTDPWLQASIDISAYVGQVVRLRFNGFTGTDFTSDMAIDDISLTTSTVVGPNINVADSDGDNIIDGGGNSPQTINSTDFGDILVGNSVTQTYTISNTGTTTLNISSIFSDNTDFVINGPVSSSVAVGATTTFDITFTANSSGSSTGLITINSNSVSPEDVFTFNVAGNGILPPPEYTLYYEHFDDGTGGWTATGTGTVFTRGTGLTTVSELGEGSYWYTNTYNDYGDNTLTTLESPIISTVGYQNLEFSADIRYNTDNDIDDGMIVEYRKRTLGLWSSWTILGNSGGGLNWYNAAGTVDAVSAGSDGWSGDTTSTQSILNFFITARHALPSTLDNSAEVQFRFVFASDNDGIVDDGVAVDNILIFADPLVAFSDPTIGPGSENTDLKLWLKATEEWDVLSDGTDITSWSDAAFDNDATAISASSPAFRDNATDNINFNPVIEFDRSNLEYMRGKGGFYSHDYFVVIKSNGSIDNTGTNRQVPIAGRVSVESPQVDGTGLGLGSISLRFDDEVVAHMSSSVPTSPTSRSYGRAYTSTTDSYTDEVIIYNIKSNAAHTETEIYKNGKRIDNTLGQAYDQDTSTFNGDLDFYEFLNQQFYLGVGRFTLNGNVDAYVDGRITEVISYGSDNTALGQQKIQSYLALKNGVTLHATNSVTEDRLNDVDYVDTQGNVIWDTSANSGYNYDIAGIGRDDDSEFLQKQSASENKFSDGTGPTSGFLSMSLSQTYDTNKENIDNNSNNFADREYLIWGNNNASLDAAPSTIAVDMSANIAGLNTNVSFIGMQRIWKVVETGDIGSVEISIPESVVRNITPPGNYLMFISETGVFTPTAQYRVMTSDGNGNLRANYNFPPNGERYITFGYAPEIVVERSVNFDSASQNYIDVEDYFDLNSAFTISSWIKRENGSLNTSILAKRNAISFTDGYDLRVLGTGAVELYWINGLPQSITSSVAIPENEWHHIAVTHDGTTARLYIDGVLDQTANLILPSATSHSFLIGAAGRDGEATNYFDGNIDEVRVWNQVLTGAQIQYLMNQELEDNPGTIGKYFSNNSILPTKNDASGLDFSNLRGYFPMSRYTYTNTNDESGNNIIGYLRQLRTVDFQTAPLPYRSTQNGDWTDNSTWLYGNMQTIPGSRSLVDNDISVDWNIVETSHDIAINNTALFDDDTVNSPDADGNDNEGNRTVLAHIQTAGTVTVEGDNSTEEGYGYTVTHYLEMSGKFDLEGESQLIQTTDSDLILGPSAELEKDQQGTSNTYHYNYWSSPVGETSVAPASPNPNRHSYTVEDIMRDGASAVNFSGSGYDGSDGTPVTIADYWIWKFANNPDGDYSAWEHVRRTGSILPGEGFTMKGPGSAGTEKNYTFLGKPNNADINLTISANNDYLVGNPYPSAIDARQFIIDNGPSLYYNDDPTNPIDNELDATTSGTLYFWDHYGGGDHILANYQGGYATYNLAGSVGAPYSESATPDPDVSQTGSGTKAPGRYIPVSQGFFVVADNGGNINFNNGQRVFKKENTANGQSFRSSNSNENATSNVDVSDPRQKIRIGYTSPNYQHRQLLLTIDETTTTGVDWGYDSSTYDYMDDDIFWSIDNGFYVIQASNEMNEFSSYPIIVYTSTDGENTIKIDDLSNIDNDQDIFVHDNELGVFHNLRDSDYTIFLNAGYYDSRFSIVFADQNESLGTDDDILENENLDVLYANTIDKVVLLNPHGLEIKDIQIFNMLGQNVAIISEIKTGNQTEYSVGNLSEGAYIIKLNTVSGSVSKKVLVN